MPTVGFEQVIDRPSASCSDWVITGEVSTESSRNWERSHSHGDVEIVARHSCRLHPEAALALKLLLA
jgi:hypothetical protein